MKKCKCCGTECNDDMLFCLHCGNRLDEAQNVPENSAEEIDLSGMMNKATTACKKNKKILIGVAGGVVGLVALAGIAGAIGVGREKINLNQYVVISETGYDTAGTAEVSLDLDRMYAEHMEVFEDDETESYYLYDPDILEEMTSCVSVKLDEKTKLSNGDKVEVKWDVSKEELKEIEREYDVKFKYKDIHHKIEHLTELEKKNFFEDVDVQYSGYDGHGTMEVFRTGDYAYLTYAVNPKGDIENGELSNGDKVVISPEGYESEEEFKQYMIEYFGVEPEGFEKEYVVEGLEKMKKFNPFEKLKVDITGKSPYLTLMMEDQNELYGIDFTADKETGIAIGDVITVTATGYDGENLEELCKESGLILDKTTEKYEISNAPAFVQSLEEIPQDILDKMDQTARQTLKRLAADAWYGWDLQDSDITFLGNYYLKRIEAPEDDQESAYTCFVYKITGDLNGRPSPLYTLIEFGDVVILEDGTPTVDLEKHWCAEGDVNDFPAYTDLDSLFYNQVASVTDRFTYVSTVEPQ